MLSCQSFAVSQSIVPNSALCRNGHCGLSLQDTETRPGDKRVKKKKKRIHFCSLLEMFGLSFTLNGSMRVCAVFYLYSNIIRKFRIDFVL